MQEKGGICSIPDAYNDFAFLLHMADQCDQLYSWRFTIFLTAMSESGLLNLSLDHELQQHT